MQGDATTGDATTGEIREIELAVPTDDGLVLGGTLALPAGPGPHPAALMLFGSGRVDRESAAGRVRLGLGPALAQALAQRGIASLRYDRRGVGASPGDWYAAGFVDNRVDAVAALRALQAHPEIRAEATAVVGHSEGAVHAAWLGAHAQPAAVVMLAGYARPGAEAVSWQGQRMAEELPALARPLLPALRWLAGRLLRQPVDAQLLVEVGDWLAARLAPS